MSSDTVEFLSITSKIKQAEHALMSCTNEDYLPQLTRLYVWSLASLGDYFYRQTLISDALNYYIQAIKKDCDEPSVLNQIGVCLIHLGKLDRALYYFDLLYRRATDFVDKALALFNSAVCYKMLGNFNEAIKLLRKSIKYVTDASELKEVDTMIHSLKELNSRQAFRGFMGKVFDRVLVPAAVENQYAPTEPDDSNTFKRQ